MDNGYVKFEFNDKQLHIKNDSEWRLELGRISRDINNLINFKLVNI